MAPENVNAISSSIEYGDGAILFDCNHGATNHGNTATRARRKALLLPPHFVNGDGGINVNWRKIRGYMRKHCTDDTPIVWEECAAIAPAANENDSPRRHQWLGTEMEPIWIESECDEMESQILNEAWEVVPRAKLPAGARVMRSGWRYLIKRCKLTGKPERYKSRFYVCGYSQIQGVNFDKTYSPVAHSDSVRMVMALAAGTRSELRLLDVQGRNDFDNLYAEMPPGWRIHGHILKLSRPVYGLKQASRRFYIRIAAWMLDHGFG